MRILFVCWRPYELFNAINMILNNIEDTSGKSDLFISNIPSLLSIKDNIESSGLFNNVGVFDEEFYKSKLRCIIDMAFPKTSIINDVINSFENWINYDVIVASGFHSFFVRMANINKKSKIIFMEDGMGTYLNYNVSHFSKSITHTLLRVLFKTGIQTINIDYQYLYCPELIIKSSGSGIKKMPSITYDNYNILCKIFNSNGNCYKNISRIIYLTQPEFGNKNDNKDYSENGIQKILIKYKKDVLVKIHPRQLDYETELHVDESNNNWELGVYGLTEKNILISVFSTASFTPYMLFGCKPILVLLYKLAFRHDAKVYEETEEFISIFKKHYPGTVFVPESIKEFEMCLESIFNKR